MPIVGDDEAAVGVKLEPVGPAIVLDDQIPFTGGRNAKNPPKGNIHHPQVAIGIEAGPFEKTVNILAVQIRFHPGVMGARFVQVSG